jgi:DNA transformation protein and related proteins
MSAAQGRPKQAGERLAGSARQARSAKGAQVTADWQGLGPRSREQLGAIGIHSPDELRAHDAFEVYARIKARWPGASRNLVYALLGAQEGRDWREIARERRTEVLLRLDAVGLAPR